MMRKKLICIGVSVLMVAGMSACDRHKQKKTRTQQQTVVAKVEQVIEPLYFSGVLRPLKTQSVLSPAAGRVTKIKFSYGQAIQKGQALVSIEASQLTQDYQKHVSDYLQKKTAYANSLQEYRGSQALYKAGVISREEYVNSQTQYRTKQLNYVQSQYDMEKILKKVGLSSDRIEKLTLKNVQTINQMLHHDFKQLAVKSSATGIALFPFSGDGDDKKILKVGEEVKQGQLILAVGDLQGLQIKIQVSEVNIDRIHPGMKARVEGNAFPGLLLTGRVTSVSSQAQSTHASTSSSEFPVIVTVPHLTTAQQQVLRVGMTAKVTIDVQNKPAIMVPIHAVHRKKGQLSVWLSRGAGNHQARAVSVGKTTPSQVAITQGLHAGDKVLLGSVAKRHD